MRESLIAGYDHALLLDIHNDKQCVLDILSSVTGDVPKESYYSSKGGSLFSWQAHSIAALGSDRTSSDSLLPLRDYVLFLLIASDIVLYL